MLHDGRIFWEHIMKGALFSTANQAKKGIHKKVDFMKTHILFFVE